MGYWKDVRERLGDGNPEAHADEFVCAACFEDEGLKGFIESQACAASCTFCGAESDAPIAAPLVEVLLYINESFEREYDEAINSLTYDEGEWMGQTWTTRELLEEYLALELPHDDDGTLMDALSDGLGERIWCRKHPYSLTDDEKLTFSWDTFCDLIKYRRRYFFLHEEREDNELYSPLALLQVLAKWCERFGLIKTIPETSIYRARYQGAGKQLSTAEDLGPPPQDKATMSNRMSPPGIVMSYVSEEAETALRETAKNPETDAGRYVVGKFMVLRPIKILDLVDIPEVPSIFTPVSDTLEYDPRPPLIFLNYFAAELSKPIARDRSIHIEYIPTQVITEFFRTEVLHKGAPLDGIRYMSARHADHWSLVLFATQDELVGGNKSSEAKFPGAAEPWIELVDREEREVTTDDLRRWEAEAPPEFEWV